MSTGFDPPAQDIAEAVIILTNSDHRISGDVTPQATSLAVTRNILPIYYNSIIYVFIFLQ
jgi:hypothetical protein